MTIYSYVGKTVELGGWTGVCRFDSELRKVFPELVSVCRLPELDPGDTVITDNHLSLLVPEWTRTIVVHHGSAKIHYERDSAWKNERNRQLVIDQEKMYGLKNREFISPGDWVREAFDDFDGRIIVHWVPRIEQVSKHGRPIIIGDWRDNNKGGNVWRALAAKNPQWDFRPLSFRTHEAKCKQYGEASLYLCLSLSEGGSYSMCDAEAAELPICTTDVGNYREFTDCEVISWRDRDNLQIVTEAIERKLKAGRQKPSFYRDYSFEKWAESWRGVIGNDSSGTYNHSRQTLLAS